MPDHRDHRQLREPVEGNTPEQTAEGEESFVGFGPVSRSQARGVAAGALLGALIGAAVAWPFGFIPWSDSIGLGWRIVACAIVGAIAGSVAGAVYGGSRLPELTGEAADENRADDETAAFRTYDRDSIRGRGPR